MHDQETLKYLNDKAVADAMMAKYKNSNGQQTKDFAEESAKFSEEKVAQ